MPLPEDEVGSLERARARLYETAPVTPKTRQPLNPSVGHELPHSWQDEPLPQMTSPHHRRPVRIAGAFFAVALLFFIVSLGVAGYFLYFGGNSVSPEKISIEVRGPSTVAGGDIVPLLLTITNKNPVAIENATVEVDFPESTRDANNVLEAYPRYTENLGRLESGATVTRSLRAVIFAGSGQTLSLPISLSYGTNESNATFVKRDLYTLAISSTPLEVSVDAVTETVSGKPLVFTLHVRSNASSPLENVVLAGTFPFGFSIASSSLPMSNTSFLLGTLTPGATKNITLVGTLNAQNNEQRVFRFSIGTAKTPNDQTPAVTYMTQEAVVAIKAPFINTTLAVNGDTSPNVTVTPDSRENVTVSYTNTLSTNITNVTVTVQLSGSAVDYGSIETTHGFYRSLDHTIVFGPDTDPALATLAPGASGIGAFTFHVLSAALLPATPSITLTTSVAGTRVGETNVPEAIQASASKTIKVATAVILSSFTLHSSGPLANTGPIPPRINQPATYSIVWNIKNPGSTVAGGVVSAVLPSYVTYTGKTAGSGSFVYDPISHTVSWDIGELAQGASMQGVFQISLTPSTSQKGTAPLLTKTLSFSGHDRFANVDVHVTADPSTTETRADPGYISTNGTVQ